MLQLLQTFFDIALWRKGPQDLPASWFLVALVLLGYIGLGLAQLPLFDIGLGEGVAVIAIDVLMQVGWLWALLALFNRRQRMQQTLTAILGVGLVFAVLDIVVLIVHAMTSPGGQLSEGWLLIRILAAALILGRILMQALDRSLFTGMALSMAIFFSTRTVIQAVVGTA